MEQCVSIALICVELISLICGVCKVTQPDKSFTLCIPIALSTSKLNRFLEISIFGSLYERTLYRMQFLGLLRLNYVHKFRLDWPILRRSLGERERCSPTPIFGAPGALSLSLVVGISKLAVVILCRRAISDGRFMHSLGSLDTVRSWRSESGSCLIGDAYLHSYRSIAATIEQLRE